MSEQPPTPEIKVPAPLPPLWRFSLAELMFFMTVAAFCSACWAVHYVLGICATAILIPGVLRAMAENRTTVRDGFVPSWQEKFLALLVSSSIVFLALLDYVLLMGLLLLAGTIFTFVLIPRHWHALVLLMAVLGAIALLHKPIRLLRETWPK